ncbi:endonuclease Q family protein [Paenibacillus macerans]|uniref:endonuclease Q family protein n=1 Tax=Paenibacillus macerans TaxID=44252 RepID=UPI001F0DDEEE|nr:endonuclease Q family protein [Paenibacillus macerans]MEC0328057.1 endonuclease Q family protein [Paenibacillus macerans]UMV46711.1 endonuclease Q family protein [Paenibacillus macerans]
MRLETEGLHTVFADLHIHIGRTGRGEPVKISGSRDLTFANIAREAALRKGIGLVGIIDCHSPGVQEDIAQCLERGEMHELAEGGVAYQETTLLLGSELEIREPGMGPAHLLAFFPTFAAIRGFTGWLEKRMKNVMLSSQRVYAPARTLQEEVYARGGMIIPAHIFTPHRSIYGSCAPRMDDVLDTALISAVELGLSADSEMAGLISELDPFTILTNSDAHSLGKIGREYNELLLVAANYREFAKALKQEDGRRVAGNYGLNPRLGKYHRTYCGNCSYIIDEAEAAVERCPYCGSPKLVRGVYDRIRSIADRQAPAVPAHRPPYHYQVPLEFIPGLGPAKLELLLAAFGTEMNILHHVPEAKLAEVAGPELAARIAEARSGRLELAAGGGGIYGKVKKS